MKNEKWIIKTIIKDELQPKIQISDINAILSHCYLDSQTKSITYWSFHLIMIIKNIMYGLAHTLYKLIDQPNQWLIKSPYNIYIMANKSQLCHVVLSKIKTDGWKC